MRSVLGLELLLKVRDLERVVEMQKMRRRSLASVVVSMAGARFEVHTLFSRDTRVIASSSARVYSGKMKKAARVKVLRAAAGSSLGRVFVVETATYAVARHVILQGQDALAEAGCSLDLHVVALLRGRGIASGLFQVRNGVLWKARGTA